MSTDSNRPAVHRIAWIVGVVIALLVVLKPARAPQHGDFDVNGFGRLPVLLNGRIKPMDTVARTSLVRISGRQSVRLDAANSPTGEATRLSAVEWLLDTLARPQHADTYPVFRIDNPDLLADFDLKKADGRYFSFEQLAGGIAKLEKQASEIGAIPAKERSGYQRGAVELYDHLLLYHQLKNSLQAPTPQPFAAEVRDFAVGVETHGEAFRTQPPQELAASPELRPLLQSTMNWRFMAAVGHLRVIPPPHVDDGTAWMKPGEALLMAWTVGRVLPESQAYADVVTGWATQDAAQFSGAVQMLHERVDGQVPVAQRKAGHEVLFNRMQPFITSLQVYLLAFLLACTSWLVVPRKLTSAARGMLLVAFVVHTIGLIARIYLQGYAPVTNLYSSAVFVGWAAVLLGLILERLYPNGIGSASAGAVGFTTLIIAHMLSLSGDTMEMMRAVLDSNFWLGTHVVTVTIGYSGMFLAGLLAIFFILRGVVDRGFDRDVAKSLSRMIYGIICFSTLFSFIGTVLGGIWADQSWGRFWGWDPKENGALLIVLWCAMVLHARWGGYVKDRGIAVLAVIGNIITAFSWFGVNLLGVGLHSYGFMDSGFTWLMIFNATQLMLIAIGLLPFTLWRSPYGQALARRATPPPPAPRDAAAATTP